MINKLIKIVIPFTVILGVFLIATSIYKLNGVSIITQESRTYFNSFTWTYYKLDLRLYLQNLKTSLDASQLRQIFNLQRPTITTPQKWDIINILVYITKLFLYIINWEIYIINIVLLAPLKLILYPVNIILAIFGVNTSSNEMIQAITRLYRVAIPYIV